MGKGEKGGREVLGEGVVAGVGGGEGVRLASGG